MSKQASAGDYLACIRTINSDIIGLSQKVENIKADTDLVQNYFFLESVLYFIWPDQLSSCTIRILGKGLS